MADALTGTAESGLDTTAYDLAVSYALRPNLYFDRLSTVKTTSQSHRGATITKEKLNDMAVATTPLNEYVDVDAIAMTDGAVTGTLAEYGNATTTTAKLRGTSMIEFDPTVANRIGYNAGLSVDTLARVALIAGATDQTPTTTQLVSSDLRKMKAAFENANVEPFSDGLYWLFISPNCAFDLKEETGEIGWRQPQVQDPMGAGIVRGEIGQYEGFRVITTPRIGLNAAKWENIGIGAEGLWKGYSNAPGFGPQPVVRPGPVTDKLMRFRPMGWYWLGFYKVFRAEAVRTLKVASTLG